jgi:hypothetical protein
MTRDTVSCCLIKGETSRISRYAIPIEKYMPLMAKKAASFLSKYLATS